MPSIELKFIKFPGEPGTESKINIYLSDEGKNHYQTHIEFLIAKGAPEQGTE